jgi:methylmalonyl-CoA epimerase
VFKKVDHIGIAVSNLDEAIKYYVGTLGGTQRTPVVTPPGMGLSFVKIALGNVVLEFLTPVDDKGQIAEFLTNHGEGLHHLAVEVEDMQQTIDDLSTRGVKAVDKKPNARQNNLSAHIYPEAMNGVSVEMMEYYKKSAI